MKAKLLKEVQELVRRRTFRVLIEDELGDDANVLPGRIFLAIKDQNGVLQNKSRFCPGGYLDSFKDFLLHFTRTINPETIWLLLALAALFGFDVFTAALTQAYLQACHLLNRILYLRTCAPDFNLKPGELLQVLLPLYCISDSGELWDLIFFDHQRDDLAISATPLDPVLFFKRNNRRELILEPVTPLMKGLSICEGSNFRSRSCTLTLVILPAFFAGDCSKIAQFKRANFSDYTM